MNQQTNDVRDSVLPPFNIGGGNPALTLGVLMTAKERMEHNQGVGAEINLLSAVMQLDPHYAWGWHCNLAMAFVDEGGDVAAANRAAARFMYLLFGIDTSENEFYNQAFGKPSMPVVLPDGSSFFTGSVNSVCPAEDIDGLAIGVKTLLKGVHPDHEGLHQVTAIHRADN